MTPRTKGVFFNPESTYIIIIIPFHILSVRVYVNIFSCNCVVISGAQAFMPEVLDPSMEQQCTGQFYQPVMPDGSVGSTGTDYPEEEPPLLEGKEIICFILTRFLLGNQLPSESYIHTFIHTPNKSHMALGLHSNANNQKELVDDQEEYFCIACKQHTNIGFSNDCFLFPPLLC